MEKKPKINWKQSLTRTAKFTLSILKNRKIATIRGIPIYIDITLTALLVMTAWGALEDGWFSAVKSLIKMGIIFGSVALHELGHSIAAQRRGIKVKSIILMMFGGIANLDIDSPIMSPKKEFWIASAGPMVNVFIIGVLLIVRGFLPWTLVSAGLSYALYVNASLFFFNMLPNYPMDGGRIYRAMITKKYGHVNAMKIVSRMSVYFMVFFVIIGVMYNMYHLAIIGVLICLAANVENRITKKMDVVDLYSGQINGCKTPFDRFMLAMMVKFKEDTSKERCDIITKLLGVDGFLCGRTGCSDKCTTQEDFMHRLMDDAVKYAKEQQVDFMDLVNNYGGVPTGYKISCRKKKKEVAV